MRSLLVFALLLTGCSVYHWDWEAAEALCKDHGGVLWVNSAGSADAKCVDGTYVTIGAMKTTVEKLRESHKVNQ